MFLRPLNFEFTPLVLPDLQVTDGRQIMGLLSLRDHVSPFLIKYIDIDDFSREPRVIQTLILRMVLKE